MDTAQVRHHHSGIREFGGLAATTASAGSSHAFTHASVESTAQYWKPVWITLEPHFRLHLAQARSNKAPKGRKSDFRDAVRIVKRLLADDLTLSFVPDAEQRRWRLLTRTHQQFTRDRVRLQNQVEGLLEEGQIKLSSVISDLLGVSGYGTYASVSDPAGVSQRRERFGEAGGSGRSRLTPQPSGSNGSPAWKPA
jgi:Transposase